MADILSQEEIDALLECVEDDNIPYEQTINEKQVIFKVRQNLVNLYNEFNSYDFNRLKKNKEEFMSKELYKIIEFIDKFNEYQLEKEINNIPIEDINKKIKNIFSNLTGFDVYCTNQKNKEIKLENVFSVVTNNIYFYADKKFVNNFGNLMLGGNIDEEESSIEDLKDIFKEFINCYLNDLSEIKNKIDKRIENVYFEESAKENFDVFLTVYKKDGKSLIGKFGIKNK